jgi:zinc transport system substrate-binding protein
MQIPVEYEGKNPSPAYLKQLINLAKEENIKTIFIQEQFDIENAKILAKEIQGRIIKINPLDENWRDQIIHITNQMQTALGSNVNK